MKNEVESNVNDSGKKTNRDTSLGLLKDTALIGGFISVIAYLITFSYEKGYNSYFYIKDTFVNELTITSVMDTLTSIGVLIFILGTVIYLFNLIFPKSGDNNMAKVIRQEYSELNFIGFTIMILTIFDTGITKLMILILVLGNIITTFFVFYPYRKVKGFKNKLAKYSEEHLSKQGLLANIRYISPSRKLLLLAFALFLIPSYTEMYGKTQASLKYDYLVINQNPPLLVIKEYKDKLLVAPLNKSKGIVSPKYQLIEYKSTIKEPLEIELIKFKDGIKVANPKYNTE